MNYADIQHQDYRSYCHRTWFWNRVSKAKFNRVHAACIREIAKKENPSRFLAKSDGIQSETFTADWIDFLIDAVLEALQVPQEQRVVWRIIIRFVLQILISSLLVAQKNGEYGLSDGGFNFQVKQWANEAQSAL